jgi:endonuclease/exonuclease/phosphatase family metal-dependent hydrolase
MSNKLFISCVVVFAAVFFSCKHEEKEEMPYLSVAEAQKKLGFSASAELQYITVKTNRAFTATSDQLWCTTEVLSEKTNNLKISVASNESSVRTAQIEISAPECANKIRIAVTQFREGSTLNIMTFNIRYDNSGDGVNQWSNRKDVAAQIILNEDIDIVGMQEVLNNQLNDLKVRLTGYNDIGVGRNGGTKGEYSPIFYKADRFTVISSGTFWLSETPDVVGSKGWDGAHPRIATWAILYDMAGQSQLLFVNTHIDHQGSTAKQEGVKLIMSRIGTMNPNALPVVLTGDFNMTPTNSNILYITNPSTPNCLLHAKTLAQLPSGPEGTSHGFGATPEAQRNFIDYIFVSEQTEVLSHAVLPDKLNNIYLSDHAPVVARIKVNN